MNVYVYNTETDENHITKDLSNLVGMWSGTIRGEIDVVAPEVLINSNITTGNYAHIPAFGRYYWIKEKTVVRENLTLLRLQSDPLFSFASDIMQLNAYVFRSSADYNMNMVDRKTPCVVYDRVQVLAPRETWGVVQFNAEDTNVYMQCIGGV